MDFVYYTDKTVSQCMIALNERLQTKSAKLEGWVEKSGRFSLGVTTTVMRRFPRTTRLDARVERENGMTVIKGFVSDGVEPRQRAIIYGALVLAGVFIIISGSLLPGLLALIAPLPLNIPLEGDCNNSQILLSELQRTLKAKSTPPSPAKKAPTVRKPTTASIKPATPKKPTTSKTATPKKTAAVGTRR
ncbi:MAG: hypothetical protein K8L97_15800 [Anaerolineae bacterium]|nr:hypothetical protein [Anaerolineae bacterium]